MKGTGFGVRPTTDTGDALEDAFVWVKPGGESDGTSDTSSARYDAHCGYSDGLQPAPEAGTWFQVCILLCLNDLKKLADDISRLTLRNWWRMRILLFSGFGPGQSLSRIYVVSVRSSSSIGKCLM